MEFGKSEYERTKGLKSRDWKRVSLRLEMQEIDFNFKVRKSAGYLQSGHSVLLMLRLRGREVARVDDGHGLLEEVIEQIASVFQGESLSHSKPFLDGPRLVCLVSRKQ